MKKSAQQYREINIFIFRLLLSHFQACSYKTAHDRMRVCIFLFFFFFSRKVFLLLFNYGFPQ